MKAKVPTPLPGEGEHHDYPESVRNILATIASSSLDALIAIDAAGNIIEFGPSAETMYGYVRGEVLGRPVAEVVIPERLRQAHNDGMRNYHATGNGPVLNNRVEVPSVRRDGTEFEAELTVVPLQLDDHSMFIAFVRDISERKRHEQELEEARLVAEQASETKSRFLAHMSHEIRSPLNAVLASVELLSDTALDDTQRRYAETASHSGRALLTLINHILDFSRIEADQLELRQESIELRGMLRSTLEMARPSALAQGTLLVGALDADLPVCVEGDEGVLRQIVTNLVDNAIKFTSNGVVTVSVGRFDSENDGEKLRIEVADTGIGIAADKLDGLFEEFVQAEQGRDTRYDGAGLGLAIVRRLAGLMGGKISARSRPGEGSRFVLEAPLRGPQGEFSAPRLEQSVLVITRQKLLGDGLRRQLQSTGASLETCPPEELRTLADDRFDQVIIDADAVDPADAATCARLDGLAAGARPLWLLRSAQQKTLLAPSGAERCLTTVVEPYGPANDQTPAAAVAAQANAPETDIAGEPCLAGIRLLLVEDSMANQLVATAILEKAGAEVEVAGNGVEALAVLGRVKPDLVLMDLRMPEMDGITATRKIRQLGGPLSSVTILALTANAVRAEIELCLASGMNDYITKPIDRKVLIDKIRQWCDRAGRKTACGNS